ncbi:MAG: hypothetical protein HY835_03445 [Anaerolineae bacterium]|nr:hypothetical protein [Anaerolineae bacterium]
MPYNNSITRSCKPRSGVSLGGIGTGGVELRQDGIFYNWHIFNNEPFATGPRLPFYEDSLLFLVVRYQEQGKPPQMKLLQVEQGYQVAGIASHPASYIFPWLSGVERIDYRASFPFTWLTFSDPEMPFVVELEAFSPFIPHDVRNSSLPAVVFNVRVTAKSSQPVDVTLIASMRNCAGYDQPVKTYRTQIFREGDVLACEMDCTDLDERLSSAGSMALASLSPASSYYTGWEHNHPYYETVLRSRTLPDFDDTPGRNPRNPHTGVPESQPRCFGSLARAHTLEPGSHFEHTFLFTWYFPNLYSEKRGDVEAQLVGNAYCNSFAGAAQVARYVRENLTDLESRTRAFLSQFYDSSAPAYVLDQINSQLNTFVSSAWLTADGNFGILEGVTGERMWGSLATIDVALYGGVAHLMLFPELDQQMLRDHARLQADYGGINHTLTRNFAYPDAVDRRRGRLDLPAEFVLMCLRNFFFTHDLAFLRDMWPHITCAIEYVLRERDANGDGLPDMTGIMCSYDNFPMYGVSAYLSSLWISALAHTIQAAQALEDYAAVARYSEVFERARQAFEAKLWNGRYYRLYNDDPPTVVEQAIGGVGEHAPLDEGCMTDQLLGQWCNHLTGLGDLVPQERRIAAYRAILDGSYCPGGGLRNCHWPGDDWLHPVHPDWWVDQANTYWSGVELAFAGALFYEGLAAEALRLIKDVDDRYRKLGLYFDHQEWGGHYYRPMAAWGLLNAMLGLSIGQGVYRFAPQLPGDRLRLFFTWTEGSGHYNQQRAKGRVRLDVDSGQITLRELLLAGWTGKAEAWLDRRKVAVSTGSGEVRFSFDPPLTLTAGQSLQVRIRSISTGQ